MPRNTKTFAQITDFTRASTATYYDASGTLQTAASGVARTAAYRYNTTSASWVIAGLLIEAQSTNLLLQSNGLGNSPWTFAPFTFTANAATSPDGTNNAWRINEGTTGGSVNQSMTFTAGVNYSFSIYAKEDTTSPKRFLYMLLPAGIFGSNKAIVVNLATFAFTSISGGTAIIEDVGNGWRRITTYATATTSGTSVARWSMAENFTTGAGGTTGASAGMFVFGAQYEVGLFATTYIPTTTAQVTRAGEVLTKALGAEFNQAGQTVMVKLRFDRNPSDAMVKGVWAWDDGSLANYTRLVIGSTGLVAVQIRVGSVTQVTVNGPQLVANTDYKIAFSFSQGIARLVVNGVSYTDGAPASMPMVSTRRIGSTPGAAQQLNGMIAEATEYLGLMSVAQMQALTA